MAITQYINMSDQNIFCNSEPIGDIPKGSLWLKIENGKMSLILPDPEKQTEFIVK
jgi:hypothetical protein